MLRLRFIAPLLVVGALWSGFLMGEDKKTEKEPIIVPARLPQHYSRLHLSQKQKNEIYKIHGKYTAEIQGLYQKINDLRDKISNLRDKDRAACEKVLTAEQKARLRQVLLGADRKKNTDATEEVPGKTDKKKDTEAKDKKDTKAKDAPVEIKKPVGNKK